MIIQDLEYIIKQAKMIETFNQELRVQDKLRERVLNGLSSGMLGEEATDAEEKKLKKVVDKIVALELKIETCNVALELTGCDMKFDSLGNTSSINLLATSDDEEEELIDVIMDDEVL